MIAGYARDNFHLQLAHLEASAKTVANNVSSILLEKQPGGTMDYGLGHLARRAAIIWKSLTGRRASINKVRPRKKVHPTHPNDDRPNFVLFVSGIAKMAVGHEPTFDQIQSTFGPRSSGKK